MKPCFEAPGGERRRRPRTELTCPLYVLRLGDSTYLETRTTNLNSHGLYFPLEEKCLLGEMLRCLVLIPAARCTLLLQCEARVVRIEMQADGLYGTACLIEHYRARRAAGY